MCSYQTGRRNWQLDHTYNVSSSENRLVQNTMHVSLSIHDQNNPAYKLHDHMIYSWIDKQVSPTYELTMPRISQSIDSSDHLSLWRFYYLTCLHWSWYAWSISVTKNVHLKVGYEWGGIRGKKWRMWPTVSLHTLHKEMLS